MRDQMRTRLVGSTGDGEIEAREKSEFLRDLGSEYSKDDKEAKRQTGETRYKR